MRENDGLPCNPTLSGSVDLSFLRTLAGSRLPRPVPIGPAFHTVVAYEAAGYIEIAIPPLVRTRAGNAIQRDAVVLRITENGLRAIGAC